MASFSEENIGYGKKRRVLNFLEHMFVATTEFGEYTDDSERFANQVTDEFEDLPDDILDQLDIIDGTDDEDEIEYAVEMLTEYEGCA